MYLCSSCYLLCIFFVSDSSIYMIYGRSFNFPYVTCYCLYLHAWTTSLDHVYVCLLCTPFGFIICTHRVAFDNPIFSCLDSRVWTVVALLCWSECVADPSVMIRVQQKLGHRRSSSSLFFSWLALEAPLAAREHPSAFVYLFVYCTFVFSGDVIFL